MSTRKERIRAYKGAHKPIGVYRVCNTVNGKSLIGAAHDVRARLNRHLAELKLKTSPNGALVADWNTYGKDAFVFEILDTLDPPNDPGYDPTDDLGVLEALWREKLQPFGY